MKKLALIMLMTSRMAHAGCEIPAAFWDWPRSAASVLAMKEIRPCIDPYLADPGSKLAIHHGMDDENMLHSGELRAWLISLAISPSRIVDIPDKGLSIEIINH